MNVLGATILAVLLFTLIFGSHRSALLAILGGVLYLTQGQSINAFGLNLYAVRILALVGFLRVLIRKEFTIDRLNKIDLLFIIFYLFTTIVFVARSDEGKTYAIGLAVDAFLSYFTFRGLFDTTQDIPDFLVRFLMLLAPFTVLVLYESFTLHNVFTIFGGIEYGDWFRGGRIRCQGSFRHASLLGTLGATFLPFYIGLLLIKNKRKSGIFGILLCFAIVWASNSGGPASSTAVGILGWLLWYMRGRMKHFRYLLVLFIISLVAIMKAPIWYVLARISSFTGGDGWHRAHLIDTAFKNLDKWWLTGIPIELTKDWFPYVLSTTGGADITNQFIGFGLSSGLGALLLFILLLTKAFQRIGQALQSLQDYQDKPESEVVLWSLGVILVVHISNWLGITYFDQSSQLWFLHLAFISGSTDESYSTALLIEQDELNYPTDTFTPSEA